MLVDYASNYAPNIYLIIKEEVHVKSEEISIDYTRSRQTVGYSWQLRRLG